MKGGEDMDIGRNIREKRTAARMSQRELAQKVDVKQSMICQIESGRKIPNMVLGKQIADALGCGLESLVM